jgi:hypothetical protein
MRSMGIFEVFKWLGVHTCRPYAAGLGTRGAATPDFRGLTSYSRYH